MQGSALLGVGFGAAGTIPRADNLRDYHYGVTPQGLLALRFIFGHRIMLDFTARDYYVSGQAPTIAPDRSRFFAVTLA